MQWREESEISCPVKVISNSGSDAFHLYAVRGRDAGATYPANHLGMAVCGVPRHFRCARDALSYTGARGFVGWDDGVAFDGYARAPSLFPRKYFRLKLQ
jgi:hypothetical protein